jgi:asparagine synthase (glutamine-hydrolysing)
MLAQMASRGPDDEGHCEIQPRAGGRLWLGSRRLAILDLSAEGHQPMRDPATGSTVVYNGEIYNFRELRRELESHGCTFRSQCDTETLLLGYRVWGAPVVERLRGMFAFALWDDAQQQLLLVRDRHGIKPLYYAETPSGFLFGSELRTLLASGLLAKEMDATGLDSLLRFGAVQEPATMIRGARLLPAGHWRRWSPGGAFRVERYWSFPASAAQAQRANGTRARYIEELRAAVADAVRMRLVSDVPVGIFLSGGRDSSVVAALAAQAGPVKTFNVTFAEQEFAEGAQARSVARHIGADHAELTVSQSDLLTALPSALAAMDQPTVDGVNTWFVSRATKQAGVTVALSGLGGDELFAGYRSFRMAPRMERLDRVAPRWARALAASLADSRFLAGRSSAGTKLGAWLRGEDGFRHPFYVSRLLWPPSEVARLLQPEWLLAADFNLYAEEMAERERLLAAHDAVSRVSCLELGVYLRNTLLRDTDCMSMAHSLEVRVPLIDHVVTEQALRLPGAWKLNGGRPKPLLMACLPRPLPEDVLRQPKRGFEFPWSRWLRGELRSEVEATLAAPGPYLEAALEWRRVTALWQQFLAGRVHWSRPWLFYVLKKWCERNLESARG